MSWRLSAMVFMLTSTVFCWVSYELGLFSYKRVSAADGIPSAVSADSSGENVDALHKALAEKNKTLMDKELEITKREQTLMDKEKILTQQMERYEKIIQDLRAKAADFEMQKDKRVEAFRAIYEKMEAKKAAKILDEMDLELSGNIIGGMRQERAAEILAKMSSDRAKTLTEKYLGKHGRQTASDQVNDVTNKSNQKGGEK